MNRESILYLLTLSLLFFTQKWNIPETKFMTYYLVGVIINFMCQLDWATGCPRQLRKHFLDVSMRV